jgi:hypothetical protein
LALASSQVCDAGCWHFTLTLRLVGDGSAHVRLVALPSFAETGQAVLVDLPSLECRVLSFGGPADEECMPHEAEGEGEGEEESKMAVD